MSDIKKHKTETANTNLMDAVRDLFPICRSITGDGMRETLSYIRDRIGIDVIEVPTGTQVFDWSIPQEWNITDGYIKNSAGERLVDFKKNSLHVVSYSEPTKTTIGMDELRNHIHTIPDRPSAIPYVTSYYKRTWGFCMSADQLRSLTDTEYEVAIESTLENGALSYGELLIKGRSEKEILISCHCCHPSLANDNLSGMAVGIDLAEALRDSDNKWSYRFLFLPGTIGAITWLATHKNSLGNIVGGLTLANLGDSGHFNYKQSRKGDAWIDRVVAQVLHRSGARYGIREFTPHGYDERQYCSPGIDLPIGSFSRSVHGTFPEYHTSDDNLSFVSESNLQGSKELLLRVINVIENDDTYRNTNPHGEPRLGARGLYSSTGGYASDANTSLAYLWILNMSDGSNSLLDISSRSGIPFDSIVAASKNLIATDLLERYENDNGEGSENQF